MNIIKKIYAGLLFLGGVCLYLIAVGESFTHNLDTGLAKGAWAVLGVIGILMIIAIVIQLIYWITKGPD